jgi:biotin carboxylase
LARLVKNVLVLFDMPWDFAQLKSASDATGGELRFFHEGFDLFSFPSNSNLLFFDIFRFVDKLVKKYAHTKIDAIISSHEQFGALSASLLAERLGLPATSAQGVMNAQHKALARTILQAKVPRANVPFESFPYTVKYASQIALPFPFFVKPVKAAYSVLARRVENFADLRSHLNFQPWEKYIIKRLVRPFNDVVERMHATPINGHYMLGEEIIDGFQVNVDGFAERGKVTVLGIVDAIMYPGTDAFLRWEYPSRLPPEWKTKIHETTKAVIEALEFDHGMFNVELKICSHSGDCKVIEVNPRMASQFSDMYEMVDGINLHTIALKLAMGESVSGEKRVGPIKFASSFVYRRFDGEGQAHFPDAAQLKALADFDPKAFLVTFKKKGNELKREIRWLRSYRYACLNMGAESEEALMDKYRKASAIIGFPVH